MTRALFAGLLPIALCLFACGGSDQAANIDQQVFLDAMKADFTKKKYGVTIDSVEGIEPEGTLKARATIRVAFKEGTGMKPKWVVHLSREAEDKPWVVGKIEK